MTTRIIYVGARIEVDAKPHVTLLKYYDSDRILQGSALLDITARSQMSHLLRDLITHPRDATLTITTPANTFQLCQKLSRQEIILEVFAESSNQWKVSMTFDQAFHLATALSPR